MLAHHQWPPTQAGGLGNSNGSSDRALYPRIWVITTFKINNIICELSSVCPAILVHVYSYHSLLYYKWCWMLCLNTVSANHRRTWRRAGRKVETEPIGMWVLSQYVSQLTQVFSAVSGSSTKTILRELRPAQIASVSWLVSLRVAELPSHSCSSL